MRVCRLGDHLAILIRKLQANVVVAVFVKNTIMFQTNNASVGFATCNSRMVLVQEAHATSGSSWSQCVIIAHCALIIRSVCFKVHHIHSILLPTTKD